jgi:hypothetical protein
MLPNAVIPSVPSSRKPICMEGALLVSSSATGLFFFPLRVVLVSFSIGVTYLFLSWSPLRTAG